MAGSWQQSAIPSVFKDLQLRQSQTTSRQEVLADSDHAWGKAVPVGKTPMGLLEKKVGVLLRYVQKADSRVQVLTRKSVQN